MPLITISDEIYEKVRELAFLHKKTQKELVEEAIREVYINENINKR